jgi:hypothetical protein
MELGATEEYPDRKGVPELATSAGSGQDLERFWRRIARSDVDHQS